MRLTYHAQGMLCPVTALMHLAAAAEMKGGWPKNRPCVVVAGGREPMQWEAYPHHQYIQKGTSIKALPGLEWVRQKAAGILFPSKPHTYLLWGL